MSHIKKFNESNGPTSGKEESLIKGLKGIPLTTENPMITQPKKDDIDIENSTRSKESENGHMYDHKPSIINDKKSLLKKFRKKKSKKKKIVENHIIKNFNIFEKTDYYNLHGDDISDITKTVRDNYHNYTYCDGILYELEGDGSTDIEVNIDLIEHTPENVFYQDQIERYVEYFEDGGITQTFPVSENALGDAENLQSMLEYLDEEFDTMYEILKDHKKLYDMDLYEIYSDPSEYGFDPTIGDLYDITDKEDLNEYYDVDNENYDKELYDGFVAILEYWKDAKEYRLTDFNHRFAALKKMGKKTVLVDPT